LDLEGLELNVSGQRYRLDTPTSVAPGQWVLATKTPPSGSSRCWGLTGVFSYPVNLILGNGGGAVGLRKGSVLIDTVDYQVGAVAVGRSIQLDPTRISARANDNPGNWCLSDPLIEGAVVDKGTPAIENHACGSVEPIEDTGADTDPFDTDTAGGGGDTGGGGGDDTDTSGGGGGDTSGGGDDTSGGGDTGSDTGETANDTDSGDVPTGETGDSGDTDVADTF
jgi:hypothetical protein